MSACPSCNLPISDPDALFCARCGFALPDGRAAREEGFRELAAGGPPFAPEAFPARPWQAPAWASRADPRAVAVGLGALAAAVVLSVWLSYGSASTPADHAPRAAASRHATRTALAPGRRRTAVATPPAQTASLERYGGAGYAFAYPSGWRVAQGDRPITSFRETVLERTDGAAKVTVDYSPGERLEPAAKASQVEAAASLTPGYRRISFRPTSIRGHAAFAWEFVVADANPRRADLFLSARDGGFALLADGRDLAGARSAARLVAGSLGGVG
jgi:hypothetical protein